MAHVIINYWTFDRVRPPLAYIHEQDRDVIHFQQNALIPHITIIVPYTVPLQP